MIISIFQLTVVLTIHDDIPYSSEQRINAHFIENKAQFLRKTGQVKAHLESNVVNSVQIDVGDMKANKLDTSMHSEMIPYISKITGTFT